jgi:hypothetical protein
MFGVYLVNAGHLVAGTTSTETSTMRLGRPPP